jgi:general secretion pathway protein E
MTTTISVETITHIRKEIALSGRSPGSILEELSSLDAREVMRVLATTLHYVYVDTEEILSAKLDFNVIALSRALQRMCLPVRMGDVSRVLISNPFDAALLQWIESQITPEVQICLATEGNIRAVLGRAEAGARAIQTPATEQMNDESSNSGGEELSLVGISEDSSPIVRLVNSTLYDALKSGASDIHFECTPQGMDIKYRIDGVLNLITTVAGQEVADQAISRIKVLAELDIAERRIPQDGRFRVAQSGRTTDLRVSIMPSVNGEDAVLRILDKRQLVSTGGSLTLDLLGFDATVLRQVRHLTGQPYGMLLVTGPTGSGKTTTLYAVISETYTGKDKIVTIEDPVEYELRGVLQIPVNEKKGLTFARGLRSILRHDPDKIMVGEIRDPETAEIAVQSALTGHLVLSTVHANSVFDVFNRFTHMGVDPYALVSALNGIWAQRLLRTVCPHCAQTTEANSQTVEALELDAETLAGVALRYGRGCGDCRGTGFRGRKAIAEILVMNDRLRELIISKASIIAIKDAARHSGTRLLREAALDMAIRGETTLEEVQRVTMLGA